MTMPNPQNSQRRTTKKGAEKITNTKVKGGNGSHETVRYVTELLPHAEKWIPLSEFIYLRLELVWGEELICTSHKICKTKKQDPEILRVSFFFLSDNKKSPVDQNRP